MSRVHTEVIFVVVNGHAMHDIRNATTVLVTFIK